MEIANEVIESMIVKFRSERKWTLQAIAQIAEEDINWAPNPDSNSIANLISHISGCVHSRIETIFLDIVDTRDRDKEFERGLILSNEQAYNMTKEAFDIILNLMIAMVREIHYHTGQIIYAAKIRKGELKWQYD